MAIREINNQAELDAALAAASAGDQIKFMQSHSVTGDVTIDKAALTLSCENGQSGTPVRRVYLTGNAGGTILDAMHIQAADSPPNCPALISVANGIAFTVRDSRIRGGNPDQGFADFAVGDSSLYPTDFSRVAPIFGLTNSGIFTGSITCIGNVMSDCNDVMKFAMAGCTLTRVKNRVSRWMGDCFTLQQAGANAPNGVDAGNVLFDPLVDLTSGDHFDTFQYTNSVTGSQAPIGYRCLRNIIFYGQNHSLSQGPYCDDAEDGTYPLGWTWYGNLGFRRITSQGIIGQGSGHLCWKNLMLMHPAFFAQNANEAGASPPFTQNTSTIGLSQLDTVRKGKNRVGYNITEALSNSPHFDLRTPNKTTGKITSITSYDNVIAPPPGGWASITTPEAFFLAIRDGLKPEYSGWLDIGATDTLQTYIDAADDLPALTATLPSFVGWQGAGNTAQSSTIESEWSFVHAGGPGSSRTLSITATSEFSIADDPNGLNATPFAAGSTAPATIAHGKWLRVRHSSAATASATSTTTVTIGGEEFAFQSQTAAAIFYPTVRFADNDLSEETGISLGLHKSFAAAWQFQVDRAPTAFNAYVLNHASGTVAPPFNCQMLQTGAARVQVFNATGSVIVTFTTTALDIDTPYLFLLSGNSNAPDPRVRLRVLSPTELHFGDDPVVPTDMLFGRDPFTGRVGVNSTTASHPGLDFFGLEDGIDARP